MKVRDCKNCGKFKHIKSNGLCSNCLPSNQLYIDKIDRTLPIAMVNRAEKVVREKFSSYDIVDDKSDATHVLKLQKDEISIVVDGTEKTILAKNPITNIKPERFTVLLVNALDTFEK